MCDKDFFTVKVILVSVKPGEEQSSEMQLSWSVVGEVNKAHEAITWVGIENVVSMTSHYKLNFCDASCVPSLCGLTWFIFILKANCENLKLWLHFGNGSIASLSDYFPYKHFSVWFAVSYAIPGSCGVCCCALLLNMMIFKSLKSSLAYVCIRSTDSLRCSDMCLTYRAILQLLFLRQFYNEKCFVTLWLTQRASCLLWVKDDVLCDYH